MTSMIVRMCNKLGLASYMLNYPQNRFSNFFTLIHSSFSPLASYACIILLTYILLYIGIFEVQNF